MECPKCGAQHRVPRPAEREQAPEPPLPSSPPNTPSSSVFVPSSESKIRSSRRRWFVGIAAITLVVIAGVAALVLKPRLKPRPIDPVEHVADEYLKSLIKGDETAQHRLSTVEEPPAIRSFQNIHRDRSRNIIVKGTFAPLARLHKRIESEFTYDPAIARFTPKNPLGAAGETLDAVHAAKEKAEKSGIYEKMASGDPNDIFDAAENFGKVFTQLAEGALAPKKILPTYKLLVDDAKPPIPPEQKELASHVGDNSKTWDALLKRPFHTLKADGPFIFERAMVDAEINDQLASLGDPPTTLRLSMVRFRLEGIDTGWRITSARRVLPGAEEETPSDTLPESPGSAARPATPPPADPSPPRSLGDPSNAPDMR